MTKLLTLALALTAAACVVPPPNGAATDGSTTTAAPAPAPAPDDDPAGPPRLRRIIPGQEATAAAPFERGDYLIALDYRDQGWGTYGFLYHGDNQWWFVENDEIVGGPHVDGGPEMQRTVAAWTQFESNRHAAVMSSIDALPHGCLDGCAFDVYQNGGYAGTRIEY